MATSENNSSEKGGPVVKSTWACSKCDLQNITDDQQPSPALLISWLDLGHLWTTQDNQNWTCSQCQLQVTSPGVPPPLGLQPLSQADCAHNWMPIG